MEMTAETYGIADNIKAADLREEDSRSFSDAPFEFENTTCELWDDTRKVYHQACIANRFSDDYLTFCGQLEKNIKQLGSFCLTKAALEQKGVALPKLKGMTIEEMVRMVSFHYRKAHAALDGVYKDNHILGITYLNWEFRWVGLGNRLKATEVKIQKIQEGTLNVDSILKQTETFKGKERSNMESGSETPQSLRAAPSALPIKGSIAREMLNREKAIEKQAELERREYERQQRAYESLQREAEKWMGGGAYDLPKPYEPTKEMKAWIKQEKAKRLKNGRGNMPEPRPQTAPVSQTETPKPGCITEAEARRILIDDAIKRKDQEALLAIPLEDQYVLQERWERYLKRIEREAMVSRNGPRDHRQ